MNIDNIKSTWSTCEETKKIRNRSAATERAKASNTNLVMKLLKENKLTSRAISIHTGVSTTKISKLKSLIKRAL